MNDKIFGKHTVLALYLNSRGFGYALFEGVNDPVDWGVKTPSKETDDDFMKQVRLFLHLFNPSVVVVQNCRREKQWFCSERTKRRIGKVERYARGQGIAMCRYSRADVRRCFAHYGAVNKDEIARAIGQVHPEFERLVPPMRKLWMQQHNRMGYFDAVALVTTFYWNEQLYKA